MRDVEDIKSDIMATMAAVKDATNEDLEESINYLHMLMPVLEAELASRKSVGATK